MEKDYEKKCHKKNGEPQQTKNAGVLKGNRKDTRGC